MKSTFALGLAAGVIFVAIFYLLRTALRKNGGGEYDERQLQVRGRAYQAAFFTLLIYLAVCILLDAALGIVWCDLGTAAFLGAALAICVYMGICLMGDAYFGLREKPITSLIVFGAVGLLQRGNGLRAVRNGELIKDGVVCFNGSAPLICGGLLMAMALLVLIRLLTGGRQEDDDEES